MKYKRFRTLFLIAAISLPTASINSSDYFSMANLQNIGTNIFAIPGSIGQFLQIDRLLSSIAPSLWNSYEAHEQRTITGVVTTLVGVIIAILYQQHNAHSFKKTQLKDFIQTAELILEDYQKKLTDKVILSIEDLNNLDTTIQTMEQDLQRNIDSLGRSNFYSGITYLNTQAMESIYKLRAIGLGLKTLSVNNELQRFLNIVTSFNNELTIVESQISQMSDTERENLKIKFFDSFVKKYNDYYSEFMQYIENKNIGNIRQFDVINKTIHNVTLALMALRSTLIEMGIDWRLLINKPISYPSLQ